MFGYKIIRIKSTTLTENEILNLTSYIKNDQKEYALGFLFAKYLQTEIRYKIKIKE